MAVASPVPAVGAEELCRARPLLGTLVEIRVRSTAPEGEVLAAIDAAFRQVAHIHALMSGHDANSDLSRLNRQALRVRWRPHRHTLAVLRAALDFARASQGAFDPCVATVLARRGLLPDHGGVDGDTDASWRDIEINDDGAVRFHRPLRIDLGGIAKGYAVDLALVALRKRLEADLVVNAGGDLRVAGAARQVRLRDPATGRPGAHVVTLHDQALASSARLPGAARNACHLVDPGRRDDGAPGSAVSVIAADCTSADALTKVVLFAPTALAARALRCRGARALVQADGRVA